MLNLDKIEQDAHNFPQSVMSNYVLNLLDRVRELEHELKNPNYLYSGTRIGRQALICRDAEVTELRKLFAELTKDMPCQKAAPGWKCTRTHLHPGPCAAIPVYLNLISNETFTTGVNHDQR